MYRDTDSAFPLQSRERRETMKLLSSLLVLAFLAATVNLSGVWTGAFRGGDSDIPQLFTLKQQGTKVTGTGGPDSTEQYQVLNGSVTGDVVKFEVDNGQRKFLYRLKGTDRYDHASRTRSSRIDIRRHYVGPQATANKFVTSSCIAAVASDPAARRAGSHCRCIRRCALVSGPCSHSRPAELGRTSK
jgi:hypothetical protein